MNDSVTQRSRCIWPGCEQPATVSCCEHHLRTLPFHIRAPLLTQQGATLRARMDADRWIAAYVAGKTLTHPLCSTLGHRLHAESAHYYHVLHCDRCHREVYGDTGWRERIKVSVSITVATIQRRAADVAHWWKCGDCGRHFGRHNETVEHLPF
ncbi:MAG TPA: hypothetical protein VHE37_15390 [Nevskiaceae bacterium]|nr:hypothetical protein [Nevskiaceae bacterium]